MRMKHGLSILALSCALGAGGCNDGSDYDFEASAQQDQITYETDNSIQPRPLFDPTQGVLPSATDLLFIGSDDYTLNIPIDPLESAAAQALKATLNELDGFSTIAPATVDFSTSVGGESLVAGETVRLFEVVVDPASGAVSGVTRELDAAEYALALAGANLDTLVMQPLQPLQQNTSYLVVFTNGITDPAGVPAKPDTVYRLLKSSEPLSGELAELEPLRQLTASFEAAAATRGIDPEAIVLSWVFSTQSITPVLSYLSDSTQPGAIQVMDSQTDSLSGLADLFLGSLEVPYYLSAPGPTDPTAPLTAYWTAENGAPLTWFEPIPVASGSQTIPLLMTVPNAASGHSVPADGWPVIIFQHGITRDRSSLLGIADALAAAGFVAVAIDLPLHGITDTRNPLHAHNTTPFEETERTFDLDLIDNATGDAGPDGLIDPSGQHYINMQSLLTSRDNLRQAVADLMVLRASLVELSDVPLHRERVHFIGHSLGAIVGSVYLALDEAIGAASLAMPGGGIARLLEGSATFGPLIQAALAANGVEPEAADYAAFLTVAQTALDAGDPVNFAKTAAALHPLHMIEVVGGAGNLPDQVVPNSVTGAPLSGTEPLARMMDLTSIDTTTSGVDGIVRFIAGDHGSVLDPSASPEATREMQSEIIGFMTTDGAVISVTDGSVVAPVD